MWISIAALNLAVAVILGAFGAHGLQKIATSKQLDWWHTGTDYFFYHALGLLALAILNKAVPLFSIRTPFWLIQIGIVFFSGSLYVMALGVPVIIAAITPLGGTLMILGWLVLAWQAFKFTTVTK